MSQRTPDWLLERIALGELPPEELAAARARLAEEPGGLERLARLESDDGATLAKLPPSQVAAEIARRRRVLEASRSVRADTLSRRWLPAVALGVPVVVGLALLMVLSLHELPEEEARPQQVALLDTTRTKGLEPKLLVHRQTQGGAPEPLVDSARARQGDVLQLSYVSAGRRYGAVLSVDGRGSVTLHFPESLTGSLELKGGTVSLPSAYELDDAPAFERFFFVTSDAPFDVNALMDAARQLAQDPGSARNQPLPLPEQLSQTSVTLEKAP
ncbi:ActD protein [Vitiosangium sp. GDMCC 1.1324]|uniref:ActD protein n=1 Tax=Vitiosangium sp. (strain GDMCC 1.1324) TaxID=2138576 RepID=UPI000D335DAB|nr:ActD protein [Vitiosangium sp. GDMCC 1.1324]PTL75921.1 ActD protein [Vitiosangium sp. GDMCC 1.1324]